MWRERLAHLLHTHDTPTRTAAAFALGVFLGFSPFLGLHALLGIAFAFAFNLNRVAVLLGVFSNLPWILPAYYTAATLAGATVLGAEVPPEVITRLREGSWLEFRELAAALRPLALSFIVGSTVGAVLLAAAAYRLSLAAILARRRHMVAAAEQTSDHK